MYWENLVFDAEKPHEQGTYWEELLRGETLSDNAGGFETRLPFSKASYLDLCFPQVDEIAESTQRVFPILVEASKFEETSTLGLRRARRVLRDLAGREYRVLKSGDGSRQYRLAAVEIQSSDPVRDAEFWAEVTGFLPSSQDPSILRHADTSIPLLVLVQEEHRKGDHKCSVHLDLRLEAGDDMHLIFERLKSLGSQELDHGWGEVPWRVFLDPSGNEFCILPYTKPVS